MDVFTCNVSYTQVTISGTYDELRVLFRKALNEDVDACMCYNTRRLTLKFASPIHAEKWQTKHALISSNI